MSKMPTNTFDSFGKKVITDKMNDLHDKLTFPANNPIPLK